MKKNQSFEERAALLRSEDRRYRSLGSVYQNKCKVYKRRWYILTIFSIVAALNNLIWNTWGPIQGTSQVVFGWDNTTITLLADWGPISFIVAVVPMCWLMDMKGLRVVVLVAVFCEFIGSGLRCIPLSDQHLNLQTALIHCGQFITGIGGPIAMAAAPMVSAAWFPPEQRTTATAISSLACYSGTALSFVIGPLLVPDVQDHFKQSEINVTSNGQISYLELRNHFNQTEIDSFKRYVQSESTKKRKKSRKDRRANTSEPSVSIDDKHQRKSEEKKKRMVEVGFRGTANASVSEESDCKEKHSKRENDKESKVVVSEKMRKRKQDESTLYEVQNICDSKNVDHDGKDKKKKKKKKKEIELENTLDTKNDKTSGLCTEVESEQSDTVKKKKKKSKYQRVEASKAALHPGVDYLRTWHFDRRNWNFKKVRQVWLLQNMFDQEQISDENFYILLKYLEGLKGTAKDKTIKMAEQRLESETGASEQNALVESRVHQVLQLLTD